MPSTSGKQKRFMAAAANNPDFAKRAGIKQSVARDFHRADYPRRKKMAFGGMMGGLGMAARRGMEMGRGNPQPGMLRRPAPPPGPPRGFRGPGGRGGPDPHQGRTGPGGMGGPQQGGGLAAMMRQAMQQRGGGSGGFLGGVASGDPRMRVTGQTSRRLGPAGGARPGQPPAGGIPGRGPQQGGLSRYGRAGGFRGGPRRPQQAPGGFSGRGGVPGPGGQNALLRTAGNASQEYGGRLNHMMGMMDPQQRIPYAVGGKVAKKSNV